MTFFFRNGLRAMSYFRITTSFWWFLGTEKQRKRLKQIEKTTQFFIYENFDLMFPRNLKVHLKMWGPQNRKWVTAPSGSVKFIQSRRCEPTPEATNKPTDITLRKFIPVILLRAFLQQPWEYSSYFPRRFMSVIITGSREWTINENYILIQLYKPLCPSLLL